MTALRFSFLIHALCALVGSLVGAAIARRVRRVAAGLLCGAAGGLAGSIAALTLLAGHVRTLPVDPQNGGHVGAPSLPAKVAMQFAGAVIGAVFTSLWIGERPAGAGGGRRGAD